MAKLKFRLPTDKRVMEVLTYYQKETGITMKEACQNIGVSNTSISNIKHGSQSFTVEHMAELAKRLKNLNVNYIFDLEPNMFRTAGELTGKQLLKLLEQKLKEK